MSTECQTEDAVVDLIRSRGEVGRKKYSQSMDRRDLRPEQWARHLQEELADALQYAERLRGACELLSEARDIMASIASERGWEVAEEWVKKFDSQFVRAPAEKAALSTGAQEALQWLYTSKKAEESSVAEARATILDVWGPAVDEELRTFFSGSK